MIEELQLSVKAGLVNIERSARGIRRAQTPPAAVSEQTTSQARITAEEKAKVEKYNRFIQSKQFAHFSPETQIAMIESFDLTPEQKAPVIQAIKERVASQKALNAEVRALAEFSPEREITAAPAVQQRFVTGSYAGTSTPIKDKSFVETSQGIKMIDWSKYTPAQKTLMISHLEEQQTKRMLGLGLFVAAPVSFVAAPVTAAIGAGASVLVSQGIKSYSGGGLLTPEEALYSAGEGAVFSTVSSGLIRGLNLTGGGMRAAAGRIGVNTALGAGFGTAGEYLATREVTGEGAALGAGFGLAFGVAGEVAAAGASKVSSRIKTATENSLERSYRSSVKKGAIFKASRMQKMGMKLTGARSPSLASEVVGADMPPPISFKMLQEQTLASPEDYFWNIPTPRSSSAYVAGAPGSRAKIWASEALIRRVSGGLSYAQVYPELLYERAQLAPKMPHIPVEPRMSSSVAAGAMQRFEILPGVASLTATLQEQKQQQRQAQLLRAAQIQAQLQALTPLQIQEEISIQEIPVIPSSSFYVKPNITFPGFKADGSPVFSESMLKFQRVRRTKKIYPILTAEELLAW